MGIGVRLLLRGMSPFLRQASCGAETKLEEGVRPPGNACLPSQHRAWTQVPLSSKSTKRESSPSCTHPVAYTSFFDLHLECFSALLALYQKAVWPPSSALHILLLASNDQSGCHCYLTPRGLSFLVFSVTKPLNSPHILASQRLSVNPQRLL